MWTMSPGKWLEWKRKNEGAEGLWRIGDDLYDLTNFVEKHPGGAYWLKITQGTDITEAFYSHHITSKPETILPKFWAAKAKTARIHPYTFSEKGFYMTLKKKIREKLGDKSPGLTLKSITIMDSLAFSAILFSILSARAGSVVLATLAGFLLALASICSHNFFHLRDNWRSYYFHLSLLCVKDWRITHVLSHHLHTNTTADLEIILFEPFFQWLPKSTKSWIAIYCSPIYSPVIYASVIPREAILRFVNRGLAKEDLISLVVPLMMFVFGKADWKTILTLWTIVILSCSLLFVFIGVTAAHHHPDIYHDGDAHRPDMDWGLHQLDTVRDRVEVKGNTFIALVTFGDHSLHHLFPTLDHSILPYLYPTLENTCKEFGIEVRELGTWDLIAGQFKQLSRTDKNETPPK